MGVTRHTLCKSQLFNVPFYRVKSSYINVHMPVKTAT